MVRPLLLNCRHSSTSPEDLPTSPAPETDLSLEPSELCTRYFIPEIQETKIQIYVCKTQKITSRAPEAENAVNAVSHVIKEDRTHTGVCHIMTFHGATLLW